MKNILIILSLILLSNAELNERFDIQVKEWMKNHNNPIEKDMIWLEK